MSEELLRPEDRIYIEMRSYIADLIDGLNSLLDKYKEVLTANKNLYVRTSYIVGILQTFKYTPQDIVKYHWNELEALINDLKSINEIKEETEFNIISMFNKLQRLKSEINVP